MSKVIKKSEFTPKKASDVKEAQEHLRLFGYLGTEAAAHEGIKSVPEPSGVAVPRAAPERAAVGEMDAVTVASLKEYQAFHNVPVTGKLDDATIHAMNCKRCGMPDHAVASFLAQGNKWTTNNITYGFQNFSPDFTQGEQEQAIAQAFALWAAETPLRFNQIPFANNPMIRIRFVAGDHGDGSSFDGASGILAHAFYPPPNNGDLAGDAHFDEAETWTINIPTGAGKIDLVTVAAHEFGHSLGLNHSSVAGSLMFPSYSGPQRFLHSDDAAGIRSIYGGYGISYASWTHGTSLTVEFPSNLESITPAGFYTYLVGKPNTSNWFHFAIPTPVIIDNVRLKIICAILRFRTFSNLAVVKHIHIYDGFTLIAAHNNINLSGDNWFAKYGVAHKPEIFWGLNISIGVEFGAGTSAQRRMDFVSAGCDLFK